jgi:hypothetical protein
MQKRSTILRLGGILMRGPAWLAGVFLLPLVLGFWYRKLYRSSQQQSTRRIELYRTWVTDEVAQLQPYQSIGYTTAQDTVTRLKTIRKRTTVQEYTYTEIQYNENQTIISFDQIPEAITHLDLTNASPPPLSLVKAWTNAPQNALEDENTDAEDENPWLPVVNDFEDENAEAEDEGPRLPGTAWDNATQNALKDDNSEAANESPWFPIVNDSGDYEGCAIKRSYIHTVELILDKLKAVGYENFAFDRIEEPADLGGYLRAAHRPKFPCDYSGYASSPSWQENMGALCSIFPDRFLGYLKDNGGHWLMKIPELSLDTATVCLACPPRVWTGIWRYWKADGLKRGLTNSQNVPCLYVMSVGQRHVRLLFEKIGSEHYTAITNGLRNDEEGHRLDCCHLLNSARDVEMHLDLIQRALYAVNRGWLDLYSQNFMKCNSGPMYEGCYNMYNLNRDDERGSLIASKKDYSDVLFEYYYREKKP